MTRTKKYVARMSVSPRVIVQCCICPFSAQMRIICDMTEQEVQQLLEDVRAGALDPATASARVLRALRAAPVEDLGFARVDTHREIRQGFPEVILGLGKAPGHIAAIAERIISRGQTLLVTRASRDAFDAVRTIAPASEYHEQARIISLRQSA